MTPLESTPRISLISGTVDRLLVRDDRQRLKRGQRQPDRRLQALGKGPHYVMLLGLGGHAVSAGHLADLRCRASDPAYSAVSSSRAARTRDLIVVASSAAPSLAADSFVKLDQLIERDRRFRRVNYGFEFGFKTHRFVVGCGRSR